MFRNAKQGRSFETLEKRSMLAGNVTASVVSGNLLITGDNSANIITVQQNANGNWQITGAATKINGSNKAFTATGVTGAVSINLNGGNDSLTMVSGNVTNNLTILMGAGNDAAALANIQIGTFLHFEGGAGNDALAINNVHVSDPTFAHFSSIDMQDGNDTVAIHNFSDQDLEVTLGNGNDSFAMDNSDFLGGPFQRLRINAGAGTDAVALTSVKTAPLFIDMGPGKNDALSLVDCTADTAALLDTNGTSGFITGAGNDFGSQTIDPNFTHRSGDLISNT